MTALMKRNELVSGLKNVRRSMRAHMVNQTPLLNISKSGVLNFGQNRTKVTNRDIWAVRPESLQHGFIAWHNGQPEKQFMVPAGTELPDEGKLPPVQAAKGYEYQVAIDFTAIKGPSAGLTVQLKKATKGACDLVEMLSDLINEKLDANEDALIPVGTLQVDSYISKRHGEIFTPDMSVDKWITPEKLEKILEQLENADKADEDNAEQKAKAERAKAKKTTRTRTRKTDPEKEDDGTDDRAEDDDDYLDNAYNDDEDDDGDDGRNGDGDDDSDDDGPDDGDDDDDAEDETDSSDDELLGDEDDGEDDDPETEEVEPQARPRRRVRR